MFFPSLGRDENTRIEFAEYDGVCTEKEGELLDRAEEIFSDKVFEAWKKLRKNYEYLTSEKAVIETIEINQYEFTVDGKLRTGI